MWMLQYYTLGDQLTELIDSLKTITIGGILWAYCPNSGRNDNYLSHPYIGQDWEVHKLRKAGIFLFINLRNKRGDSVQLKYERNYFKRFLKKKGYGGMNG